MTAFERHQHLDRKIYPFWQQGELKPMLHYYRFMDKRVVFTNGCFDILHAGHVDLLFRAAGLGDVLMVGLNTDASVSRLKGPLRPLNDQSARATVLAGLHCVDAVILFDEDTPAGLIETVSPDVLVKGGDYDARDIAGAPFVRSRGGQVVTLPLLEGYSTSRILERLKAGSV